MGKSIMLRGLAALLLVVPLLAQGAGLGPLRVLSALGQPLSAEIDVVSLRQGEEDGLTAKLGSEQAFRQAGIAYNPSLASLRFAIVRGEGKAVIRLSSANPVNEPFLELLVELQWATGRLVREYTFLLDPPEYRAPSAAAAPAPPPAPVAVPVPKSAPVVQAPAARPAPASVTAAPAKAATNQEVKKGDTLSKIARQHLSGGVTLNQMMMALYRANREAFINDNINLVRAGRILRVPDREAVATVDTSEATREVLAHMRDFGAYRRTLAAAAPAAPGEAGKREVSGQITPKPADAAPTGDRDKLKLSRADTGKPAAAASRAAREDDRAARERALKESESRITDLEKNVSDLQKLLEIKSQQVAELEKRATGKPAAATPAKPAADPAKAEPAKPAAAKPDPAKPEPAKVESAKPEAAKPEPMKPEPMKPAADKPEPAKPEAASDAPKADAAKPAAPAVKPAAVKPKPRPAPPPPPPPPSLVDEFLENPVALGGLGLVIAMLVGYGTWAWRRKKAGQSKLQDSLLGASTGGGAASVFNAPAAAAAAEEAPSVSDMAVSETSVGGGEADEVDPIAEADVYMAYGRDAQAEEILREALQKDSARPGVLAKLLEIYAGRRDAKTFEQTALKLKGLVGADGEEWAKAAVLGASIDPDNGLYSGAEAPAAPAEAAAPAPSLDFDLDAAPADEGASAGADIDLGSGGDAPAAASPSIDFDLGSDGAAEDAPKADASADATMVLDLKSGGDGGGLDFDLGDAAPAAGAPAAAKADADDGNSIDFDLNLDVDNAGKQGKEIDPDATIAVSSMDLSSINLNLDTPSGGGESDPKWQEVATKLDLAKAYEEMGDKDGARELLNEVLKEGDADQQGQAKQMLAGLD